MLCVAFMIFACDDSAKCTIALLTTSVAFLVCACDASATFVIALLTTSKCKKTKNDKDMCVLTRFENPSIDCICVVKLSLYVLLTLV